MKLEMGDSFKCMLAERCAEIVRMRVYEQHRILIGEKETFGPPSSYGDAWLDMRALLRSIKDEYDRRNFVLLVGFYFKKDRDERNRHARGRDYIRAVISCGNACLVKPGSRFYGEAQEWIRTHQKEAA